MKFREMMDRKIDIQIRDAKSGKLVWDTSYDGSFVKKFHKKIISNGLVHCNVDNAKNIFQNDFNWFKFFWSDKVYYRNDQGERIDLSFRERVSHAASWVNIDSNNFEFKTAKSDIESLYNTKLNISDVQGNQQITEDHFIKYISTLLEDLLKDEEMRGLTVKTEIYKNYLSYRLIDKRSEENKEWKSKTLIEICRDDAKDYYQEVIEDLQKPNQYCDDEPLITKKDDQLVWNQKIYAHQKYSTMFLKSIWLYFSKDYRENHHSSYILSEIFKNTFHANADRKSLAKLFNPESNEDLEKERMLDNDKNQKYYNPFLLNPKAK
ncbi:hypothetical protein GCM10011506_34150 [Marivirga lumbricoides]|uniref:EF-hand domain-containing protein n=2 Tax=Marivirga lumbricoides TaxID=1046115 RepID=A0ABQ1MSJ0_9BACT|nr:hypothetical protein GCM10011506_34150 [Marivirga lumbricoides]